MVFVIFVVLAFMCGIVGFVGFLVGLMDGSWAYGVSGVVLLVLCAVLGYAAADVYVGANERCANRGGTWLGDGAYTFKTNEPIYITIHDEGVCIEQSLHIPGSNI